MCGGYQQFKKIHLLKSPKCSFLLINILLQLVMVCHVLYSLHGGALKPHVAPWSGEKTPEKPLPAAFTAFLSCSLLWAQSQSCESQCGGLSQGDEAGHGHWAGTLQLAGCSTANTCFVPAPKASSWARSRTSWSGL